MGRPTSLNRDISPPRLARKRKIAGDTSPSRSNVSREAEPTLAAIEAGQAKIRDHLAYFKDQLGRSVRATSNVETLLPIDGFAKLYEQNQHEHGRHFVIHQHNHPQAGVHYDLRLQFSESSSLSFAIPYGLPGDPNSRRLGRMAIETRVHNVWNHLIESASHRTGSLLIWDTGTYSILPRKMPHHPTSPQTTDSESEMEAKADYRHDNEKLVEAFQTRYIRIRFNGTRLPKDYTITLRLPSTNDVQKKRGKRRRKSRQHFRATSTDSEPEPHVPAEIQADIDTDSEEDASTRLNNAYPGSTNSIGSVHQRNWFLLLDRRSSGFVQKRDGVEKVWERDGERGFEPFHVQGRDYERSVVTGRLAKEVEQDEGVEGFVGRKGWLGITT